MEITLVDESGDELPAFEGENFEGENFEGENFEGENFEGEPFMGEGWNFEGEAFMGEGGNFEGEAFIGEGENFEGGAFMGDFPSKPLPLPLGGERAPGKQSEIPIWILWINKMARLTSVKVLKD